MLQISKLVQEHSTYNPRCRRVLSDSSANYVKNFYNSNDISHYLAGKMDSVMVKANGMGLQKWKHLVSCNLQKYTDNSKKCLHICRQVCLNSVIHAQRFCSSWFEQNPVCAFVLLTRMKFMPFRCKLK